MKIVERGCKTARIIFCSSMLVGLAYSTFSMFYQIFPKENTKEELVSKNYQATTQPTTRSSISILEEELENN